jgi:HAD superfamily phosphatase (TIGR01668 family)
MKTPKGTGIRPHEHVGHIRDINFDALADKGFYIIDVDNTLALKKSLHVEEEIVALLHALQERKSIKSICLVSNLVSPSAKRMKRIETIAKLLGIEHFVCAYGTHIKPHATPFQQAMTKMQSSAENTVVIGDQLYTDIKGGNRLGLYTILVDPLGPDAWFTRARRWREKHAHMKWGNE